MVLVVMVFGAANGMYLTLETSLAVDTLHHEGGEDTSSAQLLGIWGVAAFLGAALGPMIGGPLLYLVGGKDMEGINSSEENDGAEEYSLEGYAVVLILSTAYFILSALTLCYLKQGNSY
jgi:MFS family permease